MGSFIVIVGDPVDGFRYYGPFDDHDSAVKWAEAELDGERWWVADMEPP